LPPESAVFATLVCFRTLPGTLKSSLKTRDALPRLAAMDLAGRVARTEEQIAQRQRQIAQQREVVADLRRSGLPTDHAEYLLAGLELLQAVHRDELARLLKEGDAPA
jgi:hypothetical protein